MTPISTNRKLAYFKDQKCLTSVTLGRAGRVRDRGLAYLAGLTEVDQVRPCVTSMGADAGLATLKAFPRLTTLEINGAFLTNTSCVALGGLEQLEHLRVDGMSIGDGALPHLLKTSLS